LQLSELLGFGSLEHEFERGSHVVNTPTTIPGTEQMHNIDVYCDIVENVIVSDVTTPLLRIIDITRNLRSMMMHTIINTPLFVPIQKKSFNTIQIWIMTNEGIPAPFPDEAGKSHVVLEFKKSGMQNSLI